MIFSYKRRKPSSPCYARMRFGISQQQLADILGVSRSLVTMMEQGKRKLPRHVNDIYLRLCRKADELPFLPASMTIKRGRKPGGFSLDQFSLRPVSNYRREKFDTKKSWVKQRRLMEWRDAPRPSLEARLAEAKKDPGCTAFVNKLKEEKNRLIHFYTFLEFKIELRELKYILLSAKLEGMNKMVDLMKPLEESLPDGRTKRRIESLNARNGYRQLKLSIELKKWDVVALLKTELQMNCIKSQIGLTDEWIDALINNSERLENIQYCLSSEMAA